MSTPESGSAGPTRAPASPRWILWVTALLTVLVPFLFWWGIWFGRELSDQEIERRLTDPRTSVRDIQHALYQAESKPQFHPAIRALATHASADVRHALAYVCQRPELREVAAGLLADPSLKVARQAALAMAKLEDPRGHDMLVAMLQLLDVRTSVAGTVQDALAAGERVRESSQLVRVVDEKGVVHEVQAPANGRIDHLAVRKDQRVAAGDVVCSLAPDADTAQAALAGLYVLGRAADLDVIKPYAQGLRTMPPQVTAQAINTRDRILGTAGK